MIAHKKISTMKKTHIYLEPRIFEVLKNESKIKRKRISSLIIEVLKEKYFLPEKKILSLEKIAGIWKDRDFDVDEYIREKRSNKKRLNSIYAK